MNDMKKKYIRPEAILTSALVEGIMASYSQGHWADAKKNNPGFDELWDDDDLEDNCGAHNKGVLEE